MAKIHEWAEVQTENIGEHTYVWQFCVILKGAVIGDHCNINCHVFIENAVEIGDYVTIKPGVQIWDGITLEDRVFIGPNVTFTNDLIPRSKKYPAAFTKTRVGTGASVGANATILAGNNIGENALIGAGSVVTRDVPANTVWFGNPAKMQGTIDENGNITYL